MYVRDILNMVMISKRRDVLCGGFFSVVFEGRVELSVDLNPNCNLSPALR